MPIPLAPYKTYKFKWYGGDLRIDVSWMRAVKLCNSSYCDEMGPSGDFSAHLGFAKKSEKFPGAIFYDSRWLQCFCSGRWVLFHYLHSVINIKYLLQDRGLPRNAG